MSAGEQEQVGSVGEEAARLLDAFSEVLGAGRGGAGGDDETWRRPGGGAPQDAPRDGGPDGAGRRWWDGEGLSALAADAMGALREADAHLATDGEDCRICPVCRAIHAVRETTPEVRAHLVSAARSLLAAGTALVDHVDQGGPPPPPGPRPDRAPRPPGPGPVERIDLDPPDEQHQQHQQHDQHDQRGAPGSQEEHR